MTAPKRLPPWHEHFRLPSGRELLIRPIRPDRLWDFLRTNQPMLALAQSLGFKRVREADGAGLVRVVLDLNEDP